MSVRVNDDLRREAAELVRDLECHLKAASYCHHRAAMDYGHQSTLWSCRALENEGRADETRAALQEVERVARRDLDSTSVVDQDDKRAAFALITTIRNGIEAAERAAKTVNLC